MPFKKATLTERSRHQRSVHHLRLAGVPTGIMLLLAPARIVFAEEYFNPAALELSSGQQKSADLHYFSREGGQQPGTYHVTVLLNNRAIDNRDVAFVEGRNGLVPLLTVRQLADMGVNVRAFSAFNHLQDNETIPWLGDFIPDATTDFDFSLQQLHISIPQVALLEKSRDDISPSQWDDGVAAAFMNYTLSGNQSRNDDSRWNSALLNLRSGANVGAWRLRNTSSWRHDQISQWQSQATWLERDIKSTRSHLRMGDSWTSGDVFDSVQFRGIQIMSDENMLPDSQRGFAPVIHGMARSNARVTVIQHGYIIYETVVAPGAFEIKDLSPTAQSGDLTVVVKESDGSERRFIQPWSAVPFMLRQGRMKYSVSAGRYHYPGSTNLHSPTFLQSTIFYGLPMNVTAFGGMLAAQNYHSVAFGMGKGFGDFGALSVDGNWAKADRPVGQQSAGQSVRVQYQKNFASTNTNFSMASYRYSSGGFYSFSEANALGSPAEYVNNKRSRSEVAISQGVGDNGSVSISAYTQRYWRSGAEDRTLHIGYYGMIKSVSWGAGYFYTDSTGSKKADRAISFNISVPLSALLPDSSVSYSINSDNDHHVSQQVGLSGSALENNNLYYSLQQGHGSRGQNLNSNASVDYRGSRGSLNVGISQDKHSTQFSYGVAGGVVAHAHGITLSQPLGDTFGIVRVPGGEGVAIQSGSNVRTDGRGYAVVPSLSPWHKNDIALDTESLPDNVDVELAGQTVIPGSGAVVMADYATHIGNRVLFTLVYHGATPPFGASAEVVLPESGKSGGIVAEQGLLYLSGVPSRGSILVNWEEDGVAKSCRAPFRLPEDRMNKPVQRLSVTCQ